MQVGDGIFREYGNVVGIDQFRDTVIYFRINVVGTSGEDDAAVAGLLKVCECFFAFSADVVPACGKFFPCRMHGKADRRRRNRISFGQFFHQAVGNSLFAFQ